MFTNDGGSEHLNLKKFDDILKLLLSAGYFRARVEGLTMFDKVSEKKENVRRAKVFDSNKKQNRYWEDFAGVLQLPEKV